MRTDFSSPVVCFSKSIMIVAACALPLSVFVGKKYETNIPLRCSCLAFLWIHVFQGTVYFKNRWILVADYLTFLVGVVVRSTVVVAIERIEATVCGRTVPATEPKMPPGNKTPTRSNSISWLPSDIGLRRPWVVGFCRRLDVQQENKIAVKVKICIESMKLFSTSIIVTEQSNKRTQTLNVYITLIRREDR